MEKCHGIGLSLLQMRREEGASHFVVLGDSSKNMNFPRNTQKTTLWAYFILFWQVIWIELNTFYSIYFILIGILECLPELATAPAFGTWAPLAIVIFMAYAVQALDLYKSAQAARLDDKQKYRVFRDHLEYSKAGSEIIPGDVIEINDRSSVPCDCLLLATDQFSVFINTSKIDGETEVKDRFPLKVPVSMDSEFFKRANGHCTSTPPESGTRNVRGEVTFYSDGTYRQTAEVSDFGEPIPDLSDSVSDQQGTGFRLSSNGDTVCSFDVSMFIERGSVIESSGTHILMALYTGKHCRSDASISVTATRKTMIDHYLEKLSLFIFCFQISVALLLGGLGYYLDKSKPITYIPNASQLGDIHEWKFLILVVRNFSMLSFMVPITLKFLLPVFRFIYGLFISNDLSFFDIANQSRAEALSTNITENLGALDVIVADKTGTLTKNKLTLVSLTVEDTKYGLSKQAATLVEDENLHMDFKNRQSDDFKLMFYALSACHSIKINSEQKLFGSSADEIAILKGLKRLGWRFDFRPDNVLSCRSPLGDYTMRILRINSFDRKRMRMSVVVEINDDIYCFMKGAPERVIRKCTSHSGAEAAYYENYQKCGLRTLCVSCKLLEDYNPNCPVSAVESEHRLLGTLGIEDALQDDVQLTMDLLSDAGLKIWVATGDAKLNTVVTAAMLRLVRHGEDVVHLSASHLRQETSEAVPGSEFYGFSQNAMKVPENSFSTLVNCEDSDVLRQALENKAFVNALYNGRCVVFYRCKPSTKAEIAIALQNIGKRVLGVGDGANDTILLRCSDVGIGILGKGGRRSFASCDFALPAFRNLGRLILVHGHTALHRSVLAVNFSFYKAVMFSMCQILYQIWTDCSGQSFFDSSSLTLYNNVWTLLPMVSLLFEKDISENFLYRLSFLYRKLRNPLTITPSNLTWFFSACYQGSVTIGVMYLLTGEAFLNASGKDYGQRYLSLMVYTSLVFSCAFYMAYQTNTFTYYSLILIIGNINLLIAFTACLQSENFLARFAGTSWTGFFGECFNSFNSLVILFTTVLASITPSWVGLTVWAEFKHTDSLRVIEKETLAAKEDEPLFFDPPTDM